VRGRYVGIGGFVASSGLEEGVYYYRDCRGLAERIAAVDHHTVLRTDVLAVALEHRRLTVRAGGRARSSARRLRTPGVVAHTVSFARPPQVAPAHSEQAAIRRTRCAIAGFVTARISVVVGRYVSSPSLGLVTVSDHSPGA